MEIDRDRIDKTYSSYFVHSISVSCVVLIIALYMYQRFYSYAHEIIIIEHSVHRALIFHVK